MKKLAKKIVVLLSLSTMMTMSLAGCAKKTDCESCNEKKKCHQYEFSYSGETEKGWLCSDCADEIEELVDQAEKLGVSGASFKKLK